MVPLVTHEDRIRMRHALADNLRILVRLRDEAHQGRTSADIQRWARVFDNSLGYLVDIIPDLESGPFSDADLTNVISTVNQIQSGLVSWLITPRP